MADPVHGADDAPPNQARDTTARLEWSLLGVAFAIHVLLLRHHVYGDAHVRYETLRLLVEEGKLSDARYSIVQSLLALPFYLVGKVVADPQTVCAYFNVVIFWLTLAATWRLLRDHMQPSMLRRLLLLLAAASMFGHHVQTFYSEPLGACCALLGIVLLSLDRPLAAGVVMVIGTVNAPQTAFALLACNAMWALRTRRFVQAAWPLVASAVLAVAEMVIRRGLPLRTGYEGDAGYVTLLPYSGQAGFSYPIWLGVLSLLFSFGKGVAFFAPGVLLHYTRDTRDTSGTTERDAITSRIGTLGIAYAWGLLLTYAGWWAWFGGWYWGPRFLLFASVPASLALARHLGAPRSSIALRLIVLAVLGWSVWVGVDGAVYGQLAMQGCQANRYEFEFVCWYVPEYSALFRPFIVSRPLEAGELVVMLHAIGVAIVLGWPQVSSLASDVRREILARDALRRPSSGS